MRKPADEIKKESKDYSLVMTSWHESGHIIIGIFNCFWVKEAKISSFWNDRGLTTYFRYDENILNNKKMKRNLLISVLETTYAGCISEQKFYEEISGSVSVLSRGYSSGDNYCARMTIRKYKLAKSGKTTALLKNRIKKNVEKVLSKFWDSVRVIAHALYERQNLTFRDIKMLLTTQTKHKKFWKNRFRVIESIYGR